MTLDNVLCTACTECKPVCVCMQARDAEKEEHKKELYLVRFHSYLKKKTMNRFRE